VVWDEGLTQRQRQAASHLGKHARLLAGPGTGKTLTLTRRLVKLLTEDQIPPDRILAVAFTRVNASDLRNSISDELSQYGIAPPRISTLHSYALRQLMRNRHLVTILPQPLRIADDYEENNIVRADIAEILGLSVREIRQKFDELSADWQSLAADDATYQPPDPRFMGAWQIHRKIYGYMLRSELVWQLKHALEENPDFDLEGADYLLVDEYQDLNKCDLAIVRGLAERGAEVFATGDDDQSIYFFRRAHPAGIRRFLEEYQPSAGLELDICFRSQQAIIDVGQYIANLDPQRLQKPLRACDGAVGGEVRLLYFGNESEEAWGVARICKHLIEVEGFRPDDILVLLRKDYQGMYSSILESALREVGLECKAKGERWGPMDEPAGRYLLCLLWLAVNDRDDLAWRTLLQFIRKPKFIPGGNQIGSQTIHDVYNLAVDEGLRFYGALERIADNPSLIARGNLIEREVAAIRELASGLSQSAQTIIAQYPVLNAEDLERARLEARDALLDKLALFASDIIPSEEDQEPLVAHMRKVAER